MAAGATEPVPGGGRRRILRRIRLIRYARLFRFLIIHRTAVGQELEAIRDNVVK